MSCFVGQRSSSNMCFLCAHPQQRLEVALLLAAHSLSRGHSQKKAELLHTTSCAANRVPTHSNAQLQHVVLLATHSSLHTMSCVADRVCLVTRRDLRWYSRACLRLRSRKACATFRRPCLRLSTRHCSTTSRVFSRRSSLRLVQAIKKQGD
jgi:hypothetical protein